MKTDSKPQHNKQQPKQVFTVSFMLHWKY